MLEPIHGATEARSWWRQLKSSTKIKEHACFRQKVALGAAEKMQAITLGQQEEGPEQ